MADTISDKLVRLNEVKQQIKQSIIDKGVTVADDTPFSGYATKIGEISGGGGEPATKFGASVDTWLGNVDENGVLQATTWTGALNFAGVKRITSFGLVHAFYGCDGITSVNLGSLTTVESYGLQNAFYNCTELASVDLSSLTTVGSSGMRQTFYNCKKLTKILFPSLTSVQTDSFGSSTSNGVFRSCTALTEIHFRADMQATIEALSQYANKWGATNAAIYFDL